MAWFEGFVNANDLRIHYWRTGADNGLRLCFNAPRPPFVLVHGFHSNGKCWSRVARELEGRYDVIMPDARGHGLTEPVPTDYSREVMADDLNAFCSVLGIRDPIILGHSMGGNTVASAAARYPGLMRAAIIVDPGWVDSPGPRTVTREQANERRTMTIEQLQAQLDRIHPNWHPEDRELWCASRSQLREEALAVLTSLRMDWREDVKRITCPTLLMTADVAVNGIVTPAMAAEAQALNPLIQVTHIPRAGHDIYREDFAAFMAAVNAFVGTLN